MVARRVRECGSAWGSSGRREGTSASLQLPLLLRPASCPTASPLVLSLPLPPLPSPSPLFACTHACIACMRIWTMRACIRPLFILSLSRARVRAHSLSLPPSVHMYAHTCMHACTYVHACMHTASLWVCPLPPPLCLHACMHASMHARPNTHTHTHTHTQHCREGARNSCARTGHICWGGRELDHCVHCRLSCSWPQSLGAETRRRGPWGRRRWWWRRW